MCTKIIIIIKFFKKISNIYNKWDNNINKKIFLVGIYPMPTKPKKKEDFT
jgi:hypothetical protein